MDEPIVLQSVAWMQLLWLHKDKGKIQSSALQFMIFQFNMTFVVIIFLFFPGFNFLTERLTVHVLSQK